MWLAGDGVKQLRHSEVQVKYVTFNLSHIISLVWLCSGQDTGLVTRRTQQHILFFFCTWFPSHGHRSLQLPGRHRHEAEEGEGGVQEGQPGQGGGGEAEEQRGPGLASLEQLGVVAHFVNCIPRLRLLLHI